MLGNDGPVVLAVRQLLKPLRQRPDRLAQHGRVDRADVNQSFDAARAQLPRGHRTDAPQRINRQTLQKAFDPLRRDDRQTVGLLPP